MRTDKNWIETVSGKQFWPTDPRWCDVDIVDIAHALSNICRFTGHTRKFYSVAQHSVRVMKALGEGWSPELQLWALLHDASEAYIMDLSRPIKYLPELEEYRKIESNLERFIFNRFDLWGTRPEIVKLADNALLKQERKELMVHLHRWSVDQEKAWQVDGEVVEVPRERPMGPLRAKYRFLFHFWRLRGMIDGKSGVNLYANAILRCIR